jgi:hypothetical protein
VTTNPSFNTEGGLLYFALKDLPVASEILVSNDLRVPGSLIVWAMAAAEIPLGTVIW